MEDINKFDKTDIYLLDYNDVELDTDIDIEDIDDIVLKRVKEATINKVTVHGIVNASEATIKKKGIRQWFALQTIIGKAAAILFCFITVCGITLGCIVLLYQYVPGFGIISSSSKLQVIATPYTVWKDDYYLRITSLSYNSDSKVLNFTAESNLVGNIDDKTALTYEGFGEPIIFFKEKWSQSTPNEESTGKGHYNFGTSTTKSEFYGEYKLKKELGDYYLELNIVGISNNDNGKVAYTDEPEYIVIPFDNLKLVPAEEADELEDFGQVVESNGISAVAASNWDMGKLYTDILFESSNSNEKVVSFNIGEESDIKMLTDKGHIYQNVSEKASNTGWKYLMFETEEPVNGIVSLNSLFIQKSVDKSIKLDIPKVGETIILNREVVVDGIKIMIESIKAYNVEGTASDNETGIDVKCQIVKGISNGRISDDNSYIKGELKVSNTENRSKVYSWGCDGLFVVGHFDAEQLKNNSEITFVIKDIMLTIDGDWPIPIVMK